ncbi:MAG: hypothetical protein R6U96_03075 [Promethearchaeia archaeon]
MKKSEKESVKEHTVEIANFLLRDTESLRNEIQFTKLTDMVHPLTFTYDLKNQEHLNLIPAVSSRNEEFIRKFLDLYK